jgi:hypothetical protein
MSRVPLLGGAYQAHSLIAAAQRSVNLFSEPVPEGQGEPGRVACYPTPGLRLLTTIGTGPIRGIRQATNGNVYVVSGSEVYSVNTTSWTGTALGSITFGLSTPVSMADNGLDLVIVDGTSSGWTVNLAGNTFAPISDPTGFFAGGDKVEYLDTVLIFNKPGTPIFYWTKTASVDFDEFALDYETMQSIYSDILQAIGVAKREIYLLGERTTQIWYDAGSAATPSSSATDQANSSKFAAVQSVFIDHGIAAKYSVTNYDNALFWLTRDRQGQGIVIKAADYQTKRVSTYAIEAAIAGYARIDDAIGYCYQLAGHAFYVLTFPREDKTWVYDITTELWHEWVWIDSNGEEHRHRSNCHWPIAGLNVVGDWQNGNLYALDRTMFTDNGTPIKRVRSFPHILADGRRVFYRQFLADIETGNPGSPPVIRTHVETSIIWPPQIAQLTGVSVGAISGTTGGAFIDWQRGLVYMLGQTGYQKFTTALDTQTPLVSVTVPSRFVSAGDIDPLSGDLLVQTSTGLPNGIPISKLDPNTFAVLGTFGVSTSAPSYPASVWLGQSIVCVVCNGVSFGFLKYSEFSGTVVGFRVDTMQHSGFSQAIVSGSTNNRGLMCAGASGGAAASVFLSWSNETAPAPSVPLYRIDIAASATAYAPATWPTPNPGITWTTAGTIPASAVDPTWTGLTVHSLGYDRADGNVIMDVATTSSASGKRIVKVNATTAAVMWVASTSFQTLVDLAGSRINGSLWVTDNVGGSVRVIDTATGIVTPQALTGVSAGPSAIGYELLRRQLRQQLQ